MHDYSHVHNGPGILLVAHEANFSMDETDGRRGMVYIRKQPSSLNDTLQAAFAAAKILEEDQGVKFLDRPTRLSVFSPTTGPFTPSAAEIAVATGEHCLPRNPVTLRERLDACGEAIVVTVFPAYRSHPRHWDSFWYVYPAPLGGVSRGISIGLNVNPDKLCNS